MKTKILVLLSAVVFVGIGIGIWLRYSLSTNSKGTVPVQSVRPKPGASASANRSPNTTSQSLGKPLQMPNPKPSDETPVVSYGTRLSPEEEQHFRLLAFDQIKNRLDIDDPAKATVDFADDVVVVTFPYPHKSPPDAPGLAYPGPDYVARVKIDRKTGGILEVLSGS